jgi:hypothetical protein
VVFRKFKIFNSLKQSKFIIDMFVKGSNLELKIVLALQYVEIGKQTQAVEY